MTRRKRVRGVLVAVALPVVAALVVSACGSSSKTTSTGAGGASSSAPGVTSDSVSVGLLTSLTGPTAAGFTTVPTGFNARIAMQNARGGVYGRRLKVVSGDDQGSPTQALAAAQTLVQQKNVFAIGAVSTVTFGASPYLTQQKVPVVGTALDGPEWAPPNDNMFPTSGSPNPKFPAPAVYGRFFKSRGATNVAAVGYDVPTAVASAKNLRTSVEAVGLRSTYVNDTIPLTQEGNFGTVVQQMKSQHVDGIYIEMEPSANFALLDAMRQAGMDVKAYLMDIAPPAAIFSNPQAKSDAQHTWVPSPWVPVGLGTPATKAFEAALSTYAHQSAAPDENEYDGWAAASAIIKGLEVAGRNPTRASFTAGLRKVTDFTADGLSVSPVSFTASFGTGAEGPGPAPGNCYYFSQYVGSQYVTQPKPVCGPLLPNSDAS